MATKFDAAAVLVLIIFSAILVNVSAQNSANFEENNHISTGYYFLLTNDYRLGTGHPPLTYKLGALPLLFSGKEFPFENSYCKDFLYYGCAQELLYNSGLDASFYIFLGRLPFILLAALTGFVIYMWSKELYGPKAGLVSVLLYSFSPTVLGWSALIMTDFSAAAFTIISFYFFWKHMRKPNVITLMLVGLFFGLALASKFTAMLFLPIYFIIAIAWFLSKKSYKFSPLKSMVMIAAIAFFVMWSAYSFDIGSYSDGAPQRYMDLVYEHIPPSQEKTVSLLIEQVPLPFPSYFVGVSRQAFISATGSKQSFVLGNVYEGSVWYFQILSFLVKVPVAFLLLLIITLVMIVVNKKNYKDDLLFLLLPALIYFTGFSIIINIGSGIHHILPVFLFMSVFMGRVVLSKPPLRWITYGLVAWYVIASLSAFPNYISYFNEVVDDDEGYKYFLGANLDQGQSLKALSDYVEKNNLGKIKLSYFGTTDPATYLDYEYLPSPFFQAWVPGFSHSEKELAADYTENCGKTEGIIAISISNREGAFLFNTSCYDWLKEYEPTDIIGHTIAVYNIKT